MWHLELSFSFQNYSWSTIPSFICGSVARYYTGRVLDWKQTLTPEYLIHDACVWEEGQPMILPESVCAAQCYGHCIGITDLHPHYCCSPITLDIPSTPTGFRCELSPADKSSQAATWTGTPYSWYWDHRACLSSSYQGCASPPHVARYIRQSK